MGLIFGILSNCIWQYSSLAKFKVLLYNLKYGFHDWQDFNLAPLEKSPNFKILILEPKFLLIQYILCTYVSIHTSSVSIVNYNVSYLQNVIHNIYAHIINYSASCVFLLILHRSKVCGTANLTV